MLFIFGNPYILNSVVQHFGIQEIGSEYPIDLWNPFDYKDEDYEEPIKKRYSEADIIQNTVPPLNIQPVNIQPVISEETIIKQQIMLIK